MTSFKNIVLSGTASVLAIAASAPAYAQSPAGASASESAEHEIVVTAQRRSESLQKVPISVAVVTGEQLESSGVLATTSLATVVPSLNISRQGFAQSPFMRGVGTIAGPGNESAIATYIDEVYVTGYGATVTSLANIAQLEVLKGPQGTLFGRNTSGGVISVRTRDPEATTRVEAYVDYANYDTIAGGLYATGQIAPNLLANISVAGRSQNDGWGRNLTNGTEINKGKDYQIRAKLLWTPGQDTSVLLSVDRSWNDYDIGMNAVIRPGTISAGGAVYAGRYDIQNSNSTSLTGNNTHDQYSEGVSLKVEQAFDFANVTSISAYRKYHEYTEFNPSRGASIVASAFYDGVSWFSQELRLSNKEGSKLAGMPWKWMLGGFYLHNNEFGNLLPSKGPGLAAAGLLSKDQYQRNITTGYSGFIDTTLEFLPGTRFTAGLRYTDETIRNNSSVIGTNLAGVVQAQVFAPELKTSAKKLTYRFVLDHSFTEDVMAYVSQSRGFKSGSFGLVSNPGTAPVNPEVMDATIVGLKSQFLDRKLTINLEGFYYKYKNLQLPTYFNGFVVNINAAAARMKGADLDIMFEPVENLTLRGSVSYLDAKYTSFKNAPIYYRKPASCNTPAGTGGVELPGPATPGTLACGIDASGNPTIRSPEWSASIGLNYRLPTAMGDFNLATNLFLTSKFNWDPGANTVEPAYTLLNASLGWTSPSKKLTLSVYCDNCADRDYSVGGYATNFATPRLPGSPRVYGVRAGVRY